MTPLAASSSSPHHQCAGVVGPCDRRPRLAEHTEGIDRVRALAEPFTPEAVSGPTGIDPGRIRNLAHELAQQRD